MSTEVAPREAQQLAAIFQKAYARAVALQRLDEQIAGLIEQRQKLESEFREAQLEVNEECDRMLKSSSVAPASMLVQLAEAGAAVDPSVLAAGNGRLNRASVAR